MTEPCLFWHSGGAVVCAKGALPLRRARQLERFCADQGAQAAHENHPWRAASLLTNAQALKAAVTAAESWRRAAGWANPDHADD